MVELPELNEDQRLFLKTIFEYFHKKGKWPMYLWVENTIRKTYPARWSTFDLVKVCKSLPDGFASGFGFNRNYEQKAGFIAPALYYFPEAKEEISDFIRVVRFCVDKINTSDVLRPEISSEDLSSKLHMQPLAIRKMYLLLQWEPNIMGGSGANEEWWRINLQRGIDGVRCFEGIETFEQYLEKRTALTRMFSGHIATRLVQNEPANNYLVFAKEMVMDKVKVLFLAANPLGTDRLKLDEEIRAITEKVYASEYRDYLQIESSWATRPDDLLQSLNRHRPHIVHFSGHGSRTGELILVDATGSPKAVNTIALKALFTTLKDNIQVVILNACYSRSQATAIIEVINCVVGMNDTIGDEAAIIFAASFYRALGFGRSVQEAFDQGKVALLLEGIPEENTPELLVRTGVNPSHVFLVEQPKEKQQSNQEQQRRSVLLRNLKTEYIMTHPNASERIILGTEPLSKEWIEGRLAEMGETWRQDVYFA
jgi:hypothetical protein